MQQHAVAHLTVSGRGVRSTPPLTVSVAQEAKKPRRDPCRAGPCTPTKNNEAFDWQDRLAEGTGRKSKKDE